MIPEWAEKYKIPGTSIKKIGNNYYLYYATSRYSPDKPYPVSIQSYIGKITPDGVISGRVSININKTQASLLGSLIPGLPVPLDQVIVLKAKGIWYYTKTDKKMVAQLKELGVYDNGKVIL